MGYGSTVLNGKTERAHRAAWFDAGLVIPDGFHLHHACGEKLCVNVNHMTVVSPDEHGRIHSMSESDRCPNGHFYSPENTLHRRNGWRRCRACDIQRKRKYRLRKQEKRA